MLIINFKTYEQTLGDQINEYLEPINKINRQSKYKHIPILVAVNHIDLKITRNKYKNLNIISQSVSPYILGQSTGHIVPEMLNRIGIEFSLFNHSENKRNIDDIVNQISVIQSRGVKLIVCCENIQEAQIIIKANPFAIAFEPPDLIGSNISIANYPDKIIEFVSLFKNSNILPLVGAGISTKKDIQTIIKLNARGVLLASSYIKAENKIQKLSEFLEAFMI